MDDADETATAVPVTDFDALRDRLREWCEAGGGEFAVESGDDSRRAVCRFPAAGATFAVSDDGAVDGGMPLHGFEGRATHVAFEGATLRVEGPDLSYVYRRP